MIHRLIRSLRRLHPERGAVSAEHALTMAIIAVALVIAIQGLIGSIAGAFTTAAGVLN